MLLCLLIPPVTWEAWLGRPCPDMLSLEAWSSLTPSQKIASDWLERLSMKCPLPTPCNQVSEITDSLTHFLTDYPQLCWTLSTHRSKDTELKMLWLPFVPCSASVVSCFVLYFSGSSPYETKQFLDASQIRSARSVIFLCVSHPSGSWNLISGSAFWRFAWSLFMRFCQQVQFSSQMRNDVYQGEIRSVIYQLSVVTWTMSIKTQNTHMHKET